MPDADGYHRAAIPAAVIESHVKPMQRRIFEATGEVLSLNMTVRRMIEIAAGSDIQVRRSHVSSGAN